MGGFLSVGKKSAEHSRGPRRGESSIIARAMVDDLLPLAGNLAFLEEQLARYQADPGAVDPSWRRLFEEPAIGGAPAGVPVAAAVTAGPDEARFSNVFALVNAYRVRGHLEARLDPLEALPRERHPDLDPRSYGFTDEDMACVVPSGGLHGIDQAPLREILRKLRATYCDAIGVEMMHITSNERRAWLQQRMEPSENRSPQDQGTQIHVLERTAAAEALERFVHTKYVGTKRFSLEGAESLIPLLDLVVERAGTQGVEEVVLGMAHRGRLNVLFNLMGKSAADMFAEFEESGSPATGSHRAHALEQQQILHRAFAAPVETEFD
ncbi:MAG: hypothetical protein EXR72_26565, partial [Myxococcales bacterium]|nr:hypothetical protein [Myxococcales bacterium]